MSAFLAQESNERVDVVLTLLTMAAMFLRLLTIGLGINYGMHPDKESGLDGMNPPFFFFPELLEHCGSGCFYSSCDLLQHGEFSPSLSDT